MDPIIPQPEQSQYQTPMPEHKHFLNKKFIITFVVLLVLGSGIYAGIWRWGNRIALQTNTPNFFSGCEEKNGDSYQNTVPAKIEPLGSIYVLTLHCKNRDSSIYIAEPDGLDKYLNFPVTVNYQYVDYLDQIQCVRAPCPPVNETRVKIISINKAGIVSSQMYQNNQYGFSIALPESWKGYTVLNSQWEVSNVEIGYGTAGVTTPGPIITLRHPQWTSANPLEDMPIMMFTPTQWDLVKNGHISVGAAPIPPSVLGQNSKYIIALPARYNYDFKPGWEEVDQLVHTLKAFEPSSALTGNGTLTGHVTIGPNCPVEQVGNPCTPTPEQYTTQKVIAFPVAGGNPTGINLDAQGNFTMTLPVGKYGMTISPGSVNTTPSVKDGVVTIIKGQTTTLNFSIDTGIR